MGKGEVQKRLVGENNRGYKGIESEKRVKRIENEPGGVGTKEGKELGYHPVENGEINKGGGEREEGDEKKGMEEGYEGKEKIGRV